MYNSDKTNALKLYISYIVLVTVSLLATILLLFQNDIVNGYENLWLMPLAFCIAVMFNLKVFNSLFKNIILLVLVGGYFVRFVVTPVLIALGNYQLVFDMLVPSNIEKAIFLLAYEVIFVFSIINYFLKPTSDKSTKRHLDTLSKTQLIKNSRFNVTWLLILTFFTIVISIVIPSIRDSFTTIFAGGVEISTIDYDISAIATRGTGQRAILSMFVFIFDIIRFIIPVYLIRLVYKKLSTSITSYIISSVIALTPFLFITGSNAQPFMSLFINIVMMSKLYPKPTKKMFKIYVVLGALTLFIVLGSKLTILGDARGVSGIASVALALNAYFPGIGNVAASLNIPRETRLITLFYDVFSTIPFRYSIFPVISSNEIRLSDLFRIYSGRGNQIIPAIGGAYFYFGFILAPLLPATISCVALKMKKKAEMSISYWYYFFFMFFALRMALIPNMYTHISIVSILINLFLPLYILIRISHGSNLMHNKQEISGSECQSNGKL